MSIQPYIDKIVDFFVSHETSPEDHSIGAEFEGFVVRGQSYEAVAYRSVASILTQLTTRGWQPHYEGENLLSLSRDGATITLEPGAQMELSTSICASIKEIEREYVAYLQDLLPILDANGQQLLALGVHPVSEPADIPFIPKKRYAHMSKYLCCKGAHAHTMMKCSASVQVAVDYCCEQDFVKKFRIASALSPFVYMLFDNAPLLGGNPWEQHALRMHVWNNCDSDRCGSVANVFSEQFSYEAYARYLLATPPIIVNHDGRLLYTQDKILSDIISPEDFDEERWTHLCTMVFPDVRAKNYIEIRTADALPYPLNLSIVALWKGLLYDEDNLNELSQKLKAVTLHDVLKSKDNVQRYGYAAEFMGKPLLKIAEEIMEMAWRGLDAQERGYLNPAIALLKGGRSPAQIIKDRLPQGLDEALSSSIITI